MSNLEKDQRKECLQLLAKEATTDELLKLAKAIKRPDLRSMLNLI